MPGNLLNCQLHREQHIACIYPHQKLYFYVFDGLFEGPIIDLRLHPIKSFIHLIILLNKMTGSHFLIPLCSLSNEFHHDWTCSLSFSGYFVLSCSMFSFSRCKLSSFHVACFPLRDASFLKLDTALRNTIF